MFDSWLPAALPFAVPVGFAVFVWWFSTGLIVLLDHLPRTGVRWSLVASTSVALAAFAGLAHTADLATTAGAYCAFSCALLVWGWHELTFLSGWITGPRRHALPAHVTGWPRFVESVRAILWHEIGLLLVGGAIVALTWGQPNTVGAWTFVVLWVMRTSAKLNLWLGVRNLSEDFLPPHLKYLQSFFRRRPMNGLFPVVVTAATVVAAVVFHQAAADDATAVDRVGGLLIGTLLVLGIVEHWLMVLPIEATALWRWALRRRGADPDGKSSHVPASMPVPAPVPLPAAAPADKALMHAR